MKKISSVISIVALFASSVLPVSAATADGLGPWADTVVATTQGLRQDGTPVLAVRSDPTSALGVAENDTVDGHFYSLGFGGKITVGFENGIQNGVVVVEATNNPYPDETALVEVSSDNVHWTSAGSVTEDGSVNVPESAGCVQYARITDTSNKALYEATADGYDVDGVAGRGLICSNSGRMTGGGSVFGQGSNRVTHGFELYCNPATLPNNLEVNWGKGNKFHLDSVSTALCTDDPAIDQGKPNAGFDTYTGTGVGKYNGVSGYKIAWTFVDAGEPGKTDDTAKIKITSPTNIVVLEVSGALNSGNHQAHK